MRRFGIPVLPLIVGVILGPRIELQGRRAMQLSVGRPARVCSAASTWPPASSCVSAIAVVVYVIIFIILLWPVLFWLIKKLLPARAEAAVEHLSEELHQDLDTDRDGHPLATSQAPEIKLPESSPKQRP